MTHVPTFIMLVGLPGSGKSTYAHWVLENPEITDTFAVISTDAIIEQFALQFRKTYDEVWVGSIKQATALANERFRAAVNARVSIIWDQTNLGLKKRHGVLSQVPSCYEKVAVYFEADEGLRQQRLAARVGKTVPDHIDQSMRESYVRPTVEEGFIRVLPPCDYSAAVVA